MVVQGVRVWRYTHAHRVAGGDKGQGPVIRWRDDFLIIAPWLEGRKAC